MCYPSTLRSLVYYVVKSTKDTAVGDGVDLTTKDGAAMLRTEQAYFLKDLKGLPVSYNARNFDNIDHVHLTLNNGTILGMRVSKWLWHSTSHMELIMQTGETLKIQDNEVHYAGLYTGTLAAFEDELHHDTGLNMFAQIHETPEGRRLADAAAAEGRQLSHVWSGSARDCRNNNPGSHGCPSHQPDRHNCQTIVGQCANPAGLSSRRK